MSRYLLFDLDGTLTESGEGIIRSVQYALEKMGKPETDVQKLRSFIGPPLIPQFMSFSGMTREEAGQAVQFYRELHQAGVDVTLICDNMASMVMKNGWVQACFVGCDRVAANGDAANKIGTSGVAILAKHYGIPFYVLGPTSTIDLNCPDGDHIPIEQRDPEEIRSLWYREPMAPAGVKCFNPAFDVTHHSLISGIITEKGICRPPFPQSLAALFSNGAR